MENARISSFATFLDADDVENVIQIRERERQKMSALVINGKKPLHITLKKYNESSSLFTRRSRTKLTKRWNINQMNQRQKNIIDEEAI